MNSYLYVKYAPNYNYNYDGKQNELYRRVS